jgi:hypothetical protein
VSTKEPEAQPRAKLFGRVMLGVILVALGWAALKLVQGWREDPFELSLSWAFLSLLPLVLGYLGVALAFQRILHAQAPERARFVRVFELYCRGLVARYLPGKVGLPAVRMAAARELGVSPAFMAASTVLEALASLATAGVLVALLALGPWGVPGLASLNTYPWAPWAAGAIVLGVIVLAIVDVRRYPAGLMRLIRLDQPSGALLPVAWIVGEAWLWVMNALSCACVVFALGGSLAGAWLGAATAIIAPALGFFVVVAPGGLGAREFIAMGLMTPAIGPTRAIAFGLVTRAALLASELGLWLASHLWLALAQPQPGEARDRAGAG